MSPMLITALASKRWRTDPYLLTGWLWYLVTLAPVSGVLQSGWQGQADRFLYVPSLGLFLAAVWSIGNWALAPRVRRAAAGLVIIMIGATVVSLMIGPVVLALMPFVVGLLAVFVAYGRWKLAPISSSSAPSALREAR